jgi:hypothetical protein
MSTDLVSVLLQFQPDAPELKSRRDYDQAARNFVTQLSNISASHWTKAADTPDDVLEVWTCLQCTWSLLNTAGTQPDRQLNSLRVRPPP